MEILPQEMVEKISRHLTPRDLASCCRVCRDWYIIFNEDCHWKPHVDPDLEEHLCTTPSIVEPVFMNIEHENSTLPPISCCRLAFLKEKHLWNNWKKGNHKKERISALKNEVRREFLTNTLLVRWCSERIEIWDVSQMPASFLMKTNLSINLKGWTYCSVVGSTTLLVEEVAFIKVFHVNTLNNSIELKHNIFLQEPSFLLCRYFSCYEKEHLKLVKRNIYVRASRLSMDIIDLKSGKKVKTESCPAISENVKPTIKGIKGSPSGDNILVVVHVPGEYNKCHCYIYSLEELMFLPVPVIKNNRSLLCCYAIHRDFLAVGSSVSVKIYNYKTSETLFIKLLECGYPLVFNDSFIFLVESKEEHSGWLEMFSPTNKKSRIFARHFYIFQAFVHITNDKFVNILNFMGKVVSVWEASGESLKRSDISSVKRNIIINQAFTRSVDYWQPNVDSFVYYYL